MSLPVADFDYDLPKGLIAQTPIPDRTASRLMVLDKRTGEVRHDGFRNILEYVSPGDCLVLNNSKVIPARLTGFSRGKEVELLLLRRMEGDVWEALAKPGKRTKIGDRLIFGGGELEGVVTDIDAGGNRIIRFEYKGIWSEILERIGEMPIPPYITEKLAEKERYQTVYAKHDGSAAAPTAGLHFTEELLRALKEKGVYLAEVTLHVGLGTFRPVKVSDAEEHKMHAEFYNIESGAADLINNAKSRGGRIIAVGTTACRVLESRAGENGVLAGAGWTDIFIYPGYTFKAVDALITNFHLPKSTLLMLVSAMSGRERVLAAYYEAVREGYRFFSFGDAMFII